MQFGGGVFGIWGGSLRWGGSFSCEGVEVLKFGVGVELGWGPGLRLGEELSL